MGPRYGAGRTRCFPIPSTGLCFRFTQKSPGRLRKIRNLEWRRSHKEEGQLELLPIDIVFVGNTVLPLRRRNDMTASDKIALAGFVVNGWNNVEDNNTGKTVAAQAVLKPVSKLTFTQNYTVGKEQSRGNDDAVRHLIDTIAIVDVTPTASLMANSDYGMDQSPRNRLRW